MTRIKLYAAVLAVAFGFACATKAGTGALVGAGGGAALGAGIGALAGGGKGALIGGAVGAGVGAATGAVIGHYMDKQEEDLKKNVKGANVERQGDKLVVRFNSAILFDTNRATLKPASEKDLGEFAKVLTQYPDTELVVEGHTDNKGKKARNKKLSIQRAESVVTYLESQGVARTRMSAQGLADERPVGDNATAEGRQANRRVEIQIAANEKLKQQDQQAAGGGQPASAPGAAPQHN
jgi:outer membrane protein OmpA-like peptidoglycan-associated protein